MDALLNKVGSYWLGQKASKEFNSVGDDINSLSTSIEGGTKWLVNKLKGKMQKAVARFAQGDSSVVRFLTIVTGYLEKGKIADIEGMKTKVMIWVKVTCIASSGSKLNFTAGMKKSRDRVAYETPLAYNYCNYNDSYPYFLALPVMMKQGFEKELSSSKLKISLSEWLGALHMVIFSKTGGARGCRSRQMLQLTNLPLSGSHGLIYEPCYRQLQLHVTMGSSHWYKSCTTGSATCIGDSYGWPDPDLTSHSAIVSP
ncbi:hypothetical protein OIU78_003097 [Salix suchowensis]|nr:hypothetical protein OIU78_003097 [Salix suchowensis]